ncbi:acyl carrier protein [bacterium]|nr:acyl carrier protein [bacterium]
MDLQEDIKKLIISSLELEDITPSDIEDDAPLFNEGLGLDSIDALELGMALKRKYGVQLSSDKELNKKYFYSVKTLAEFVKENTVE